jgi:methyl-accepting chemotaxis protein
VFSDNKLVEALRAVGELAPALQAVVERMDKMEAALRDTDATLHTVRESLDRTTASLGDTRGAMTTSSEVIAAAAADIRDAAATMSAMRNALDQFPGIDAQAS